MPYFEPIDYTFDGWAVIAPLIFNLFDVLTGFYAAWAVGQLDSSRMRDGLKHKVGFMLALAFAILCEAIMTRFDIGFEGMLLMPLATYIIVTEVVSICENLRKVAPELADSPLFDRFKGEAEDE